MKKFIASGLFLLPAIALAQVPTGEYAFGTINLVEDWIERLTPLVIGAAMLFFLYGLMKFVLNSGNEEAKEEGKRIMIWGIISLFVMVSVWGLVGLLNQETGIDQGTTVIIPDIPGR